MEKERESLRQNLRAFWQEFEEVCQGLGRKKEEIKVLFATKYLSPEKLVSFLEIARQEGLTPLLLGENRVQEAKRKISFLKEKRPELLSFFSLTMIGHLQRNKVGQALSLFSGIYSVDSLRLIGALEKRLAKMEKKMPIFLEVNLSGEKTKFGFKEEEVEKAVKEVRKSSFLQLEGLMTMTPLTSDEKRLRKIFRRLKELAIQEDLKTSMGMSQDWKIALEEGAEMIRVGRKIFNN